MACASPLAGAMLAGICPTPRSAAYVMSRSHDLPTLDRLPKVEPTGEPEDAVTVTLLHHPDPSRVGDVYCGSLPIELSRLGPELHRHGRKPRALDDPYVSRKPLLVERARGRKIRLCAPRTKVRCRLEGRSFEGERELSSEELERGVVITMSDRVALLVESGEREVEPIERHGLVGVSRATGELRARIDDLANDDATVLLRGATGTGKELVARAIHDVSPRHHRGFIAVNMAAIPPSTAASQLFGHARGAFTGAHDQSLGFFGQADGGTLFLDELGETASELQPQLLRALEYGEIQPVGGAIRTVDARLIAATDSDLESRVDEGTFRRALFHRIAGCTLWLEPLRDRRADIAIQLVWFLREELMARGGADRLAPRGTDEPWLPLELTLALLDYSWPGNSRELKAVASHIATSGMQHPRAKTPPLPLSRRGAPRSARPSRGLSTASSRRSEIGPQLLRTTLESQGYRVAPTAKALGIAKNTLYALMDDNGIPIAKNLSAEHIMGAQREVGDRVTDLARRLQVSEAGLKLRMRELGIS